MKEEDERDIYKYLELVKDPNNLSRIYEPTEENIQLCAEYIKKGGIVGMPTETVYGLAANAFDVEACFKILHYKGRPLSDPLIVHVSSIQMAKKIVIIDEDIEELFGGEESFKKGQERDKLKKELSEKNGIKLLYVNYWEDITVDLIKEKLLEINIDIKK